MNPPIELAAHPAHPPHGVTRVTAAMGAADAGVWLLTYQVHGELPRLAVRADPVRTDGLWQTTCFELFVRPHGASGYFEFNFAPSSAWAAYAFEGYREGMCDLPLPVDPAITRVEPGDGAACAFQVRLTPPPLPSGVMRLGLSAVIEAADGSRSFWALAHPPAKPDFHDPACFALELPAPPHP